VSGRKKVIFLCGESFEKRIERENCSLHTLIRFWNFCVFRRVGSAIALVESREPNLFALEEENGKMDSDPVRY
jgi:hypothetical protein